MTLTLSEMTIRNEKVLSHLRTYLYKISSYSNFDEAMKLRIFVDSEGDFTAFEAVEYMLGFTSSAHKLSDTIRSRYTPLESDYRAFSNAVALL